MSKIVNVCYLPPFTSKKTKTPIDVGWSPHIGSSYAYDELIKYISSINVRFVQGHIKRYHEDGYIYKPHSISYTTNCGKSHQIDFDCELGHIINKWTAPLSYDDILFDGHRVPFVFTTCDSENQRDGRISIPHIFIESENFISARNFKEGDERRLMMLVDELGTDGFMRSFLQRCTPEIRIRHILTCVTHLQESSGK